MDFYEPIYLQAIIEIPVSGISKPMMDTLQAIGFELKDFERTGKTVQITLNGTIPYSDRDKYQIHENYKSLKATGVHIKKIYVVNKLNKVEV